LVRLCGPFSVRGLPSRPSLSTIARALISGLFHLVHDFAMKPFHLPIALPLSPSQNPSKEPLFASNSVTPSADFSCPSPSSPWFSGTFSFPLLQSPWSRELASCFLIRFSPLRGFAAFLSFPLFVAPSLVRVLRDIDLSYLRFFTLFFLDLAPGFSRTSFPSQSFFQRFSMRFRCFGSLVFSGLVPFAGLGVP